jgi:hypothetical protein
MMPILNRWFTNKIQRAVYRQEKYYSKKQQKKIPGMRES